MPELEVSEVDVMLEAARSAYARHDWTAAWQAFRSVGAEDLVDVDDLHALAQCSWWLGDMRECDRYLEVVHRRYLEMGRQADAANAGLQLAIDHLLRGDEPVGSGWMQRATRIAEGLAEGPIHGYLLYTLEVEANFRLMAADEVIAAAQRVRGIGERCGEATLVAAGLNGEGRMLIRVGRVLEGLALLDEAMVSVVADEVDPAWAGNLYCNTIAACHELGDFQRMARWTTATERWLEQLPPAVLFAGICRVHRAQLHTLRGDWAEAERQASTVCEELRDVSVDNVAAAWYEIAEVRRRRGDFVAAEAAYDQAHAHGRDPQPGLALLRLGQGGHEAAASAVRSALITASSDRLDRAHLCAAGVEIALAGGATQTAREHAEELRQIADACESPGLEAMTATALGATLLAEGHVEAALERLREGCRAWRRLSAPYETARTRVLLARCYGELEDLEAADRELEVSADAFERLGAAVDAAEVARLRGKPARPGGLSDREIEVLGLVAEGRSNREIAAALFISQKTVARHLSNLFSKLAVGSRTEAARFAFDHRLLPRAPRGRRPR